MSSILDDTKKNLGIAPDYTAFDLDVKMHINSALATLNQLGVGPAAGFEVVDSTAQWVDFLGTDVRYNAAKTYVFLKTRLVFDPPATSYLIAAVEKQIDELEWRLNVLREETAWIDPLPPVIEETVYDGGAA
jgi:hypothetical protein